MKGNNNANSQVLNSTNNFVAVGGNDRIGSSGNDGGSNRRSGYMQQASAPGNNYSSESANGR